MKTLYLMLRERFGNFAKQYDYQTIIVFLNIPLATIRNRIEQNEKTLARHKVKHNIIEEMAKTFEPPQPDENAIKYYANQPIDEWIAEHLAPSSN